MLRKSDARTAADSDMLNGKKSRKQRRSSVRNPAEVDATKIVTPSAELPLTPPLVIGVLVGVDQHRRALVDYPENGTGRALVATTTRGISEADVGRDVVLLLRHAGDVSPAILGVLQTTVSETTSSNENDTPGTLPDSPGVTVESDGERLLLTAAREIVLRCGDASITLNKSGKIVIRGTHLTSRSSGTNRIQGGSVQIN